MVLKTNVTKPICELFSPCGNGILRACLQETMGTVYTVKERSLSVMAVLGDFRFFAGKPNRELLDWRPQPFSILVPSSPQWEQLMEKICRDEAVRAVRYSLHKPETFDCEKLRCAVDALPAGYTLQLINQEIYAVCLQEEWSRDLVSQYPSYFRYQALGLGVAALKEGKLAAGASSYASYPGGIEIEIDTKKEHRRKGLAYACGARLILECISRGLCPGWDAQNKESLALAEKLGYRFHQEYPVYVRKGDRGS